MPFSEGLVDKGKRGARSRAPGPAVSLTAFFLLWGKMRARIPLAVWKYGRVLHQPFRITGFADATRGMRRGQGFMVQLLHKLLFPERILAETGLKCGFCGRVETIPSLSQREEVMLTRWPVQVSGLALSGK